MGYAGLVGATRRQLLRSGLAGAGTLTVAGSGLGMFARTAHAAVVPDGDLAYLRLLAAAELLKADFQTAARRSPRLPPRPRALVGRFHAHDKAHYDPPAPLTKPAGEPPPAAGDI